MLTLHSTDCTVENGQEFSGTIFCTDAQHPYDPMIMKGVLCSEKIALLNPKVDMVQFSPSAEGSRSEGQAAVDFFLSLLSNQP